MTNRDVYDRLTELFARHYGARHRVAAYAPGRVEVLGNHTDYNEGYVLSAAINLGTFFAAAPREDSTCRLVAGDLMEEETFTLDTSPDNDSATWAKYIIGILCGLDEESHLDTGFDGMFLGNIPLGAGLSSSAALEMCCGLALCALYGVFVDNLTLARIGQAAEHEFVGVRSGLLDQISSLFGRANHLVMSDFRSLAVENVPLAEDACFLVCDTGAGHALVDGIYNERRAKCEEAARFFDGILDREIGALRDVSWEELQAHSTGMDPESAQRAAHVIGENRRVIVGRKLLEQRDLEGFGRLMFESHASSMTNFDNSCVELDAIVDAARKIPGALGARLSGGGFGGSAVVLLHQRDVEVVTKAIATSYEKQFGRPCDIHTIIPSNGAITIPVDYDCD